MRVMMMVLIIFFSLNFQQAAAQTQTPFSVSAEAAIMIESQSGRVLYEKNGHERLRIASITKIMTALLAIESGKLAEEVMISSAAERVEGSAIYVRAGEKWLLEDLVYGLMLQSGNDAAVAIAEHVGGSIDGFVYMMNERAKQLGMTNTNFQNPHGLDDHEDHYSTAYDMAILTQYAMGNETYREISSTKKYTSTGKERRYWTNKNRLLTELYRYSTGGKTGFTKRAKRTLVSTATKDNMDLIAVTLNAPSDWHDHMNLFNWAFSSFEMERLVAKGKQKNINDSYYDQQIFAPYDFELPLTLEERKHLKKKIVLYIPKGELDSYEAIGKIEFLIHDEIIGKLPLFYEQEKQKEKTIWRKLIEMIFFAKGGAYD